MVSRHVVDSERTEDGESDGDLTLRPSLLSLAFSSNPSSSPSLEMIDDPPSHSCQKLLPPRPPKLQGHCLHMCTLRARPTHTQSQPSSQSPRPPGDNQSFSSALVFTKTPTSRPYKQTCRPCHRHTDRPTHTLAITPTETSTFRQQVWIRKELEMNEWIDRSGEGQGER